MFTDYGIVIKRRASSGITTEPNQANIYKTTSNDLQTWEDADEKP